MLLIPKASFFPMLESVGFEDGRAKVVRGLKQRVVEEYWVGSGFFQFLQYYFLEAWDWALVVSLRSHPYRDVLLLVDLNPRLNQL